VPGFEEVEHTADWSFRARGRDLAELFSNAARALSYLEELPRGGTEAVAREVEVEGFDTETLLVNWLNELLYLGQAKAETYDRFEISSIADGHLRAQAHGYRVPGATRRIKAVTFHNLNVTRGPEGWEATVVVDV